jgi:hypothetical protein
MIFCNHPCTVCSSILPPATWFQRLEVTCDKLIANCSVNVNLRRYVKGGDGTAGEVCALGEGAAVDLSPVMGKGFDLSGITTVAQAECPNVLLFATGSGISPIRALISSGTLKGRAAHRLLYL